MFAKTKRIKPDAGELEIVYEVEWKTPGNDDDKAKIIGILDTLDTNLDWNTFKSYLIQNSGNMHLSTNDIKLSYIDSDEELVSVDNEGDFRKCLKFSRKRAKRGKSIMLKVGMASNGGAKPKENIKFDTAPTAQTKPKLFCIKRKEIIGKNKYVSFQKDNSDNENDDEGPPEWFQNYMGKFKSELVREISDIVLTNIKSSIDDIGCNKPVPEVTIPSKHHNVHHHVVEKRKKKKKMPEEDSSDCTEGLQLQWEDRMDLLRHMQKISKREKKFEKKLDAKLEKLESKTKKIMEKKSQGLLRDGLKSDSKRRSRLMVFNAGGGATAVATTEQVMDALPVDEFNYVPHVSKGEIVTKTWKVVNSGQLPWTDETELTFAWGSIVPLMKSVKCPHLQPGETGKVKIKLQAPSVCGNFETYWYFHHGGRRFGHWLGCNIVVDPDKRPETPPQPTTPPVMQTSAVDLTMKCPTKYTTSTTDDMKIFNSETKECETETANPVQNTTGSTEESTVQMSPPDLKSWANYAPLTTTTSPVTVLDDEVLNELKAQLLTKPEETDNKIENVTKGINNIKIYGVPPEWKAQELADGINIEEMYQEEKRKSEEYNSASDSDNISVISGTISIDTDDTEPSEEFVVIPMPPCFNCEQALKENPVTQPISVEIPKTPPEPEDLSNIQESDNNNNMELKPYPELPMFLPVLQKDVPQAQESGYSEGENDLEKPQPQPEPVVDDKDPNNVYIRDNLGRSIPVAKVLKTPKKETPTKENPIGFNVNVGISHNTFGDPNIGHGPNGPRFPFGMENNIPLQCPNPGSSSNFRPQHECPKQPPTKQNCGYTCGPETNPFKKNDCHCPNFPPPPPPGYKCQYNQHKCRKSGTSSSASSSSSSSWSHNFQNIHTEQPRSYKYSHVFEKEPKKQGNGNNTNNDSRRTSSCDGSREQSPVAAAVQILPETLVTGAVNVASSAINTARTVIDMLLPRHDDVVTGHWDKVPAEVEESLRTLSEMGFTNRELNIMLLNRHFNDVSRVVTELVQYTTSSQ